MAHPRTTPQLPADPVPTSTLVGDPLELDRVGGGRERVEVDQRGDVLTDVHVGGEDLSTAATNAARTVWIGCRAGGAGT